ncbi:MAG: arsenite methyltransferase [Candidatus Bathyarchaeota archaeon]|nr:arsenite methyltransferase [Candidatus Bathyarchaeota archaeon]
MDEENVRRVVRKGYSEIAKGKSLCCGSSRVCCDEKTSVAVSRSIGYSEEELASVPEGANLGLGCGNPVALASLRKGECVVDLGSGAGFDCFLAAKRVGEEGRVVGVDMTPEMVDKARANARKGKYWNVEFRLGEIENLPVADNFADVVISNCVINLSPNKKRVFEEAFRVLKLGGRLMVSDIVLLKLPSAIRRSVKAYVGCVSGAMMKEDYLKTILDAGFQDVKVVEETRFPIEYMINDPTAKALIDDLKISRKTLISLDNAIASIKVSAVKRVK